MFIRLDYGLDAIRQGRQGQGALAYNSRQRGFTLIELIVTILIVAILAAVAVPAFVSNTPSSDANALNASLQFARTAAVKQGQPIIVCPSTNGTSCSGATSWSSGWIVLAPSATQPSLAAACAVSGGLTGDQVLQNQSSFANRDTSVFTTQPGSGNTNTSFCFVGVGTSPVTYTGMVQFDSNPVNLASRRCLTLAGVGHIQILKHGQSDSSGVFTCP